MRKFLKVILPLLMISSLLIVGAGTTNATSANWGVKTGDSFQYTIGWQPGLNLPQSVWDELSAIATNETNATLGGTLNQTVNVYQLYSDFNSLPNVFNMNVTVGNMLTVGTNDTFNSTLQMKLVNDTSFMDVGPFLSHLMTVYNSSLQNYNDLISSVMGMQNYLGMMAEGLNYLPAINLNTSWNSAASIENNSLGLFVPTDFSFINLINKTAINNQMSQPISVNITDPMTNISSMVNFTSTWAYLQQKAGLPSSINNIDALLTAFGVTTFNVQDKSVLIKYNFSDMNQTVINDMIAATPLGSLGITNITDLLDMASATGFNITLPTISGAIGITYNNAGVLQNAHFECDLATTINGTSYELNPVVDVSSGIHQQINANWNPSGTTTTPTIPGFSIWLIGLASLGGMTAVVLSMKKKKR